MVRGRLVRAGSVDGLPSGKLYTSAVTLSEKQRYVFSDIHYLGLERWTTSRVRPPPSPRAG